MFERETEEMMKHKTTMATRNITTTGIIFIIASIIMFVLGVIAAFFLEFQENFIITGDLLIDFAVLTSSIFFISLAFNSYLTPIIFLLIGIKMSPMVLENNSFLILLLPLSLGAYAAITATISMNETTKGNMRMNKARNTVFIIYAVSVILALIAGYALPLMPVVKYL